MSSAKAEWHGKLSNYQIASLSKSKLLKATNTKAVRPVAAAHVGIATDEGQVPRVRTKYVTIPIVAVETHKEERTTAASATACHGQFKRRGESTGSIVAAPALTLSLPFCFCWQAITTWARIVGATYTLP